MPYLSDFRDLAIAGIVNNVLDGKFNRVLQENSKVTVAMTSELTSQFATVIVGRELLIDAQQIPATNASPRNPEDIVAQTVGRAGEEIIIGARNGNAAANELHTAVFIEPI